MNRRRRRQDEERIFVEAYRSRVGKSRRARSSMENGVITRRCRRARIVVQSLIPRDDTGCKTAVFVPRDSTVNARSSRRSDDAAGHRADRVQLEELKIHLRARERINGRVERTPISRSTRFDGKRNRDNNRDGLIIITDFSDATPSTSSPATPRRPPLPSLAVTFIYSS